MNLSEVESASTFLQHERVLDQRESVLVEAFPLETFKVGLNQRFFSPNVLATSLKEFWKYDRASNWAGVGQVLTFNAVEPFFIAASLVDLRHVAIVGVARTERATRARRIERDEAMVVEIAHLIHATHPS